MAQNKPCHSTANGRAGHILDTSRMAPRSVFFVSDGTGITAETFGKAILAQFEVRTRLVRVPFVDTVDLSLIHI